MSAVLDKTTVKFGGCRQQLNPKPANHITIADYNPIKPNAIEKLLKESFILDMKRACAILFSTIDIYQYFEVYYKNVVLHVYEAREITTFRL